ncbi:hypothetical protein ABT095_05925 [Kitasatospora sp. NPDC002227]|uniref:hypothetical protein n=1 Tax=Kitasatospora sp. NPDC002227 TaxID=3154773 RepID=UPI00332478E4
MSVPLPLQIGVSLGWLLGYLLLSIRYDRVWDGRIRAELSRRLGTEVRWGSIGGLGMMDGAGGPPAPAWVAEGRGGWGQQLRQAAVIRCTQLAVLVLLGCGPVAGLLGLQFLLDFNGLVIGATAFLVIPVFALYWVGNHRRGR